MTKSNIHIANINKLLKGIKSEICTDFIHPDNREIIITINEVVFAFNLNAIEKYLKDLNNVNSNKVMSSRLP